MKIDAHHHFWKYNPQQYGWINEKMKVLKRDFLPEDLEKEMKAQGMEGSILVQARQDIDETAWLLELADKYNFIKGVVAWVDLCSATVEEQLRQFASHKKLVGIRHVVQDEPDDQFMLRKDFINGISLLQTFQLAYDILVYPKHLPTAIEFVSRFPEQRFVVDHIAKPFIGNGTLEPWKSDIARLAEFPNVYCKISGMVTEANWHNWKPEDFHPYLETVYNCFGEDRVMIGTDWPVCLLAASYEEVLNIPLQYFGNLTADKLAKLMGENCRRFYRF